MSVQNLNHDSILKLGEAIALLRVSRSLFYKLVKAGVYPRPVQLGARRVGWRMSDIQKIIQQGGVAA